MVDLAPGDTVINVLKNSRKDRDTILGQFYKKDEEGKIIMENDNPKIFLSNGIDVHNVLADITRKLSTLQNQQRMLCNLSAKWVNEAVFGEGSVRGFVWPFGQQIDHKGVTAHVRESGYYGARDAGYPVKSFSLPEDRFSWKYCANHRNLLTVMADYEALPDDGELKFFSFGVHSIDYERDNTWG
jgi:hypothetical protein